MANDFEEKYVKHLEWNRDTNGRLYYVLWVLFIGGFTFSFQIHGDVGCFQALGIGAFRVLAIIGCVVNFFYQEIAIDSVGELQQKLMRNDKCLWLRHEARVSKNSIPEKEYQAAIREANDEESKVKRHQYNIEIKDHINRYLRVFLLVITILYLTLALFLSFTFYPVW
jgi:hypothetical protein